MIRAFIFPAQCRRARGQLVSLTVGEYITITPDSVLSVTMAPRRDDIDITFAIHWRDGRCHEYNVTPRGSLNLSVVIGFVLVPRAIATNARGTFERLVVEFVSTADFSRDLLGTSSTQQR